MILIKTFISCNSGITVIYGDRGLGGVTAACGESLDVTPFRPVCLRKTLSLRLLRCKPLGFQQEETGTLVTHIDFWRRII